MIDAISDPSDYHMERAVELVVNHAAALMPLHSSF